MVELAVPSYAVRVVAGGSDRVRLEPSGAIELDLSILRADIAEEEVDTEERQERALRNVSR